MTRTQLVTGVAVVAALAVVAIFFLFGNPFMTPPTGQPAQQGSANLVVQDEEVGTGAVAQAGDTIVVAYVGKLDNGTTFDSATTAAPAHFQLGVGKAIPGWDQGLQGMKVGGKRLLIIPPNLAYGAQGMGPIPPNATLIFEVQLIAVSSSTNPATPPTVQ